MFFYGTDVKEASDTQTTNKNDGKAFKTFQTEEEYQDSLTSKKFLISNSLTL